MRDYENIALDENGEEDLAIRGGDIDGGANDGETTTATTRQGI